MQAAYYLRHKNYDVALLQVDTDNGTVLDSEILSAEDMPIIGDSTGAGLNEWLDARSIPNGRSVLEELLKESGCETSAAFLVKNMALSLSDTYWLCPESAKELTWDQVNLFSHKGEVLTFHDGAGRDHYTSPNAALTGALEKTASYTEDGWHLVKEDGSYSGDGIRNVNEAFATMLHDRLGICDHVSYSLNFDETGIAKTCECRYFTNENLEFISAYDVTGGSRNAKADEKYNGKQEYERFIDICEAGGLNRDYVRAFMDYQALTDFLISNTDRHWNNFGILRDPETLEFVSMAPIFDSGTSMLWDNPFISNRVSLIRMETHGIERHQEDQLKLVQNKDIVDISKLPTRQEVADFYAQNGIDPQRAEQIANGYALKMDMLCEFQHGYDVSISSELEHNCDPPYVNLKKNPNYHEVNHDDEWDIFDL